MSDIKTLLKEATIRLTPYSETARIDAEILLAHVLKKTRSFLYTHPEHHIMLEDRENFANLLIQRLQGIPIAYLTGSREFWTLSLKVSKETLIPRPETELLVELALQHLANKDKAKVLDLGTGSGAIALACASEKPSWEIHACDASEGALQIARENAQSLSINNIFFYHSYWFEAINPALTFDAILSNPPYIAEHDPHIQEGDLRFEPRSALVAGADGLSALRYIIHHSLARLQPGGLLLFEHGFDQKNAVRSMLNYYGYEKIQSWQDWQGKDRISGGWRRIS